MKIRKFPKVINLPKGKVLTNSKDYKININWNEIDLTLEKTYPKIKIHS